LVAAIKWTWKTIPHPIAWLKNLIGHGGDQRVHAVVTLMWCATICYVTIDFANAIIFRKMPITKEFDIIVGAGSLLIAWIYRQGSVKPPPNPPTPKPGDAP